MTRRWIREGLGLCFLFAALVSSPADALESVVKRTTLLVSDIERSIAFYKSIGFSPWLDRAGPRSPNGAVGMPLNEKSTTSRIVILSGQHPDWAMIGLLQFDNPPLPWTRDPDDKTIGTSDAVLVIVTDDIETAHENAVAQGATILDGPHPYTSNSVVGKKFGSIMFLQDPDGWVIEMTQVDRIIPHED
ncbi:MAG: VOC family protein [Rhodospirillaceae bacterium]|jgi:catechol 2,3-dioxygenase-like lactoylglutathione lyase family enzyme|nr:VOC family protein [Rhodospirillaceae bacterium]MBT5565935.1 VOC family protein [Rhodospirillaceae bacterium]MBT6088645.1 VOC family protein [Rhodospirillaceae bacterium]MBT6960097.1 VOC family protein [Rhodospirillaceae bacterium]MBT7449661.1 VOC family protein [Rhodospirillaceae bacterium]